ncbi:MAG: transcription antitermination factor NusB [bacterium]|nr:transcription antitermination factor NusB [bacterium]MDY2829761.1 transcription antitermination factor NusB [Alphaproteobacteria bacterium]
MAKFISEKIKKKSAARLAAVQATYMIEYGQLPVDEVIKDFVNGEIGRYAIEEESDGYEVLENMVEIEEMDADYFSNLTRNVHKDKEHLERSLAHYLKQGWQFDRFDGTLRALLLCAAYELVHTTDVDAAVIVKEYVDLAYAFFSKNEPKMVNALLDTIAKEIRPAN